MLFDFRSGNSGAHIHDVHLPSLLQLSDAHHLVRRDAARRAGISPSAWSRAHQSRLLEVLQPGVSRIVGLPAPPHQDLAAAVAAAGEGAVASMRSASRLWGVELPGEEIDVTLPGRRHPRLKGVAIHRPTDLDDLRAVRRLGIPATNPLRTSLDIGAVADPDTVGLVVEHFLVMKSFQLATLNRAITRHSARGRAGLGHLRLLLDDWCLGGKPPDSVLEPAVGRLLVDHGLPTPMFHHVLGTRAGPFELDFAFVPQRVDLEVDGWATHGGRRAFEADRARDAYITGAGWVVVRVTWFQVMRRPAWVAARLTEVLQQR